LIETRKQLYSSLAIICLYKKHYGHAVLSHEVINIVWTTIAKGALPNLIYNQKSRISPERIWTSRTKFVQTTEYTLDDIKGKSNWLPRWTKLLSTWQRSITNKRNTFSQTVQPCTIFIRWMGNRCLFERWSHEPLYHLNPLFVSSSFCRRTGFWSFILAETRWPLHGRPAVDTKHEECQQNF
jgi:hypothetical protein